MTPESPNLTGVPETMLWTLHNRASEMLRDDAILKDEKAYEIYRSIDYDFEGSFGKPDFSHAMRSLIFDQELKKFLQTHPNGVIVNLGEGLETQRFRINSPEATWFTVDLPESIAIRERFIQPDENHIHISCSALDTQWIDAIPTDRPVYITAQGLFMYFQEQEVKELFIEINQRLPGACLAFDNLPRWMSKKTLKGWKKTESYTTPPMPWGVNRDELKPLVESWIPGLQEFRPIKFTVPRGIWRYLMPILEAIPVVKNFGGGITAIQFAASERPDNPAKTDID
jgi:O-methyltransferase involved in polyketide biosynthesis